MMMNFDTNEDKINQLELPERIGEQRHTVQPTIREKRLIDLLPAPSSGCVAKGASSGYKGSGIGTVW